MLPCILKFHLVGCQTKTQLQHPQSNSLETCIKQNQQYKVRTMIHTSTNQLNLMHTSTKQLNTSPGKFESARTLSSLGIQETRFTPTSFHNQYQFFGCLSLSISPLVFCPILYGPSCEKHIHGS